MSSPIDGNGKRNDPSAYAPKWVRDSDRERSHEDTSIPEDKYPQQSEQSVPETVPASDQARSHRPFDTTFSREASPRAESELPEGNLPRSLNPQFLRDPPRTPRTLGRLAVVISLIIAASVGAAIALFATGKLPSELNKMLGLSADNKTIASKPAGDTRITGISRALQPHSRPLRRQSDPAARIWPELHLLGVQPSAPRPFAG